MTRRLGLVKIGPGVTMEQAAEALVREARKPKPTYQQPSLEIAVEPAPDAVRIYWTRRVSAPYARVFGWRQVGGLMDIDTPQNLIVDSAERESEIIDRPPPGDTYYYAFQVGGDKPPPWWALLGVSVSVRFGKKITFSVHFPNLVNQAEQWRAVAHAMRDGRRYQHEMQRYHDALEKLHQRGRIGLGELRARFAYANNAANQQQAIIDGIMSDERLSEEERRKRVAVAERLHDEFVANLLKLADEVE